MNESYVMLVMLLSCITSGGQFIREIKAKSSASVYLARQKTPVEGMHIFVIRGTLAQVEEAVRLISKKTGSHVSIHVAHAFYSLDGSGGD